jgi:putative transposase
MFFGGARFAYNWGLKQRIDLYTKEKKSTSSITQHKEFNKLKKTEYTWAYLYSKCVFQSALQDLEEGFNNFFRGIKTHKKVGFPKFKSKKNPKQSFRLTGTIKIHSNKIQLPRLGILKLKENNYIPINEHILSATVSKKANRYFVSVQVEKEKELPPNYSNKVIGIDSGIKNLAVTSDGMIFENPKPYKKYLEKLKMEQRRLSRKAIGSNNRKKQQIKVGKVHFKISNIRKDAIHKMTSVIVEKQPMTVVIENLAVSNMVKNHNLAQSLLDSSFGEIKRQFEYKCKWNNVKLVLADRFYPSSKLCSVCGYKKEDLKLSDRVWNCSNCNSILDRDLNAAINLSKYTVSSTGINASGEDRILSSLKEEITPISNFVGNL